MKILKFLMIGMLFLTIACQDGYIDDVEPKQPGEDREAPEVDINFPLEGTLIRVVEDVTSITFDIEAIDDIEIKSVTLQLDGTTIVTFTEFMDYRRALEEHTYDNLTNGPHTFTVIAEDMAGKTTTVSKNFQKVEPYKPIYDGEIFYMPFDGDYLELLTLEEATVNGTPTLTSDSKAGLAAYKGAAGSYLTFPASGLLNNEFSAVMWYKMNADPNRAGILVIGPPYPSPPQTLNNGFKFFREAGGDDQRFKVNAGTGSGNSWFDGGDAADLDPTVATDWVHLAFTIAEDQVTVYIEGEIVSQGVFAGIGWQECEIMSIMSGAPNFSHWDHLSDRSQLDELRIFNKALTQDEIKAIIEAEK